MHENKTYNFFFGAKKDSVNQFYTQYYIRRDNSLDDKSLLVAPHNFSFPCHEVSQATQFLNALFNDKFLSSHLI
jgi:hypothetical protein